MKIKDRVEQRKTKKPCAICIRDTSRSKLFTKAGLKSHTQWKHKRLIDLIPLEIVDPKEPIIGMVNVKIDRTFEVDGTVVHASYGDQKRQDDPVHHPGHYTFSQFEVFDVLQVWFPDDPLLWQTVKYCARAEHKGQCLVDLQKAEWYLQKRIAEEQRKVDQIAAEVDAE